MQVYQVLLNCKGGRTLFSHLGRDWAAENQGVFFFPFLLVQGLLSKYAYFCGIVIQLELPVEYMNQLS